MIIPARPQHPRLMTIEALPGIDLARYCLARLLKAMRMLPACLRYAAIRPRDRQVPAEPRPTTALRPAPMLPSTAARVYFLL
jgi:hypothetical protein